MADDGKILGYPKAEWIIALIIGVVFLIGFKACSGSEPSKDATAKRCTDSGMAFVMSQNFVKRQLKSPSSAKFPSRPISATQVNECSMQIMASFDAQNSFGAQLRGHYQVTMHYDSNDKTWSATGLIIE
ncbi:MAG: hypothetical protein CML20_10305 [Rheinheimera sp.]|uniref:hypothetical protein n=1 Tax=Arsukibacterium sp. UBA3155 TaxID=1946058 RepID=UPI000C92AE5C|nr:hypothetical protein [Arsukibacterium sp. UBA3155]MAD75165.1 hypothetical protein [Rheinheimera sp.]|tara:strand:- start:31834 stop:32220 length:387 start_codon:yes stop_codon:yes gene_type:complete